MARSSIQDELDANRDVPVVSGTGDELHPDEKIERQDAELQRMADISGADHLADHEVAALEQTKRLAKERGEELPAHVKSGLTPKREHRSDAGASSPSHSSGSGHKS